MFMKGILVLSNATEENFCSFFVYIETDLSFVNCKHSETEKRGRARWEMKIFSVKTENDTSFCLD